MEGETPIDDLATELAQAQAEGEEALLLSSWEKKAECGSEVHQLALGQRFYLLSQTDGQTDGAADNGSCAVQWLVKASTQGNEEATRLLAECLDKGIGITEQSKEQVSWCLQTPTNEKRARLAAQKLHEKFRSTMSEEGSGDAGAITKDAFKKALDQSDLSKREKKLLEKAGNLKSKARTAVTESEFVESLMRSLHGYGGTIGGLLQRDVEWEAYVNSTMLQKVTKYPGKTLSWLADNAIEVTGKQGMSWLRSLIPTNQIYMLMVFFLYSLLSAQVIFWFLPLLVFYIAFITMLVCTVQMFYTKRKSRDVRAIADMLSKFSDTLSSDSAESAYTWSSLTPYMVYFVALIVAIPAFLLADKTWIPCSEMSFIAGFFTVGCFFALSDKYDHLAILSMLLDNLSTLPAILEGFPQIPVLYHILSFLVGSGISIELLPDMYLQIGLPSLAYLVVPVLFLRMARQNSWQGTYRILVPHLVCFFWWRLAMMFFRHSTWLGMIRASIGWVSFMLLLPFLLIFILIWVVMYLSSVLTLANMLRVVTTLLLLAIPAGFAFWARSGFKVKGFSPDLNSSKVKALFAAVFVLSVLPLTFLFSPPERDVSGHYVTWELYREMCSYPRWDQSNMAAATMTCSHMAGMMVHWTGRVKKIVVKNTDNQAETFINMLPWAMANWLRCTYGVEYPNCDNITEIHERQSCQINRLQGRECHMKNLDRYLFEMWVHMPVDAEREHDVRVEAGHWFKDALLQISDNDEVEFRASLQSELGNVWPVLRLYHVRCLSCTADVEFGTKGLTSRLLETYGILLHFKHAFQGLWNFFLAPVVQFYFAVE